MANVAIFESMTPYWIDMQNALHDNNGYEMYYVYNSLYGYDSTPELRQQLHFTPHQMSGKHKNSLRLKELNQIIRDNQPQNVISIEFSMLTVQLLLIRLFSKHKFRIIVRCDDSLDMLQHPYSKIHALARSILGKYVDNIILCDKRTQEIFQNTFHKGLYFPIVREESKFQTSLYACKSISEFLSQKYELREKKVLLYVGRIDKNKNLTSLIKALITIDRNDLALVVVGDGPQKTNVMSESRILRCPVIFTGMLSQRDLLPWYNIADVLCLVSFKETFGAVVNEALLAGIKCIVSKTAGASHLIQEGKNGYTCNPYSSDDIATKIKNTLNELSHTSPRSNLMPSLFCDYYRSIEPYI